MIDSVILKLHDLRKHQSLADHLYSESLNSKTMYAKTVEGELNRMPMQMAAQLIKYGDTGNEFVFTHYNKIELPSSQYMVVYQVNFNQDYIYFNFSIPKYLYGNNVTQFIPPPLSRDFSLHFNKSPEFTKTIIFKHFIRLIKYFFKKEFPNFKIDLLDLEISRIDICYNQIFKTKDDALNYLELMQKINIPKLRETSSGWSQYKSGITYKSELKYFKCYHKGIEYQKTNISKDIKHNEKINKQIANIKKQYNYEKQKYQQSISGGLLAIFKEDIPPPNEQDYISRIKELESNLIDTETIQNEADKILRYEISITSGWMSSVYSYKVYRKNCKIWATHWKQYRDIMSKTKGGNEWTVFDKIKTVEFDEDDIPFLKKIKGRPIRPNYIINDYREEKEFFKMFHKFATKRRKFMVAVPTDVKNDAISFTNNTASFGLQYDQAEFSNDLLQNLVTTLFDYINAIQVKKLPTTVDISLRIDEYNKNVDSKLPYTKGLHERSTHTQRQKYGLQKINKMRCLQIIELIQKYTMDELRKMNLLPKSTYNEWKKKLQLIGLDKNHLPDSEKMPIAIPSIDYEQYYLNVLYENNINTKQTVYKKYIQKFNFWN